MTVVFRLIGEFKRGDVIARWGPESPPPAEIEKQIEQAWRQAQSRPGIKLFDGPLCRLERFHAGEKLELELTRTSYKTFWGTNLTNPALADQYGQRVMANPVGLSCALESSDGHLIFGRRNAAVAYYPLRIHPFAGSLEPAAHVDVFADVERELAEELAFGPADIARILCIGMVQDVSIHQPELVFHVRSTRPRSRIEQMLDAAEHEACVAIESSRQALESALKDPALTPVALGTALLWGRGQFGAAWFDAANRAVNLGRHESQ